MENLAFGVSLEDRMSGPAKSASDSLAKLAGAAGGSAGPLKDLAGGFIRVVQPAEVAKNALASIVTGFNEFTTAFSKGDVGGAIRGIGEAVGGLTQSLDLLVPGLGQATSALIKFGTAGISVIADLVLEGAKLAVSATQSKQAMVGMFAALTGGVEQGAALEESLSNLSDRIGITKDDLAPLTRSFLAMGIEGTAALERVTLAAASAQAIMGSPHASEAFATLTKRIQVAAQTGEQLKLPAKGLKALSDIGLRVDDVAKKMNVSAKTLGAQLKAGSVNAKQFGEALQSALIEKGQEPLKRIGMSMESMGKMLHQSIEDIFEDVKIQPFVEKMHDLVSLFSQASPLGQLLKSAATGAFSAMFEWASKLIPKVEILFLDLAIRGVQAYNYIYDNWSLISTIFDDATLSIRGTINALEHLVPGLAEAAGFLADAFGDTSAMDMSRAGATAVDSYANALTAGVPTAAKAGQALGKASVDGARKALDAHSPSRVMAKLGGFAGTGFSQGLSAHAAPAASVGAHVGGRAVAGVSQGISAVTSANFEPHIATSRRIERQQSERSRRSEIGPIHLTITAPNGVTNAMELTEIGIATVFERIALQQGL